MQGVTGLWSSKILLILHFLCENCIAFWELFWVKCYSQFNVLYIGFAYAWTGNSGNNLLLRACGQICLNVKCMFGLICKWKLKCFDFKEIHVYNKYYYYFFLELRLATSKQRPATRDLGTRLELQMTRGQVRVTSDQTYFHSDTTCFQQVTS